MGLTSKAVEKLPTWAKVLVTVLAVPSAVYGIVHFGFWSFLLRAIFSPEI